MDHPSLPDEFVIEEQLGAGGQGSVFLARNQVTNERYAVKAIRSYQLNDQSIRSSFFRELYSLIDLPSHPHMASFWSFRIREQQVFLFFEFVEGGTLERWIALGRLVTTASILDVAIQMAWGLGFAHEHGFVHQDVKPRNVLMTSDGIAKVIDFGFVGLPERSMMPSENKSRLVTGFTRPFCSPEQKRVDAVDLRTDIWSWGLIVLAMYNGSIGWTDGAQGGSALETYLNRQRSRKGIEPMPQAIITLLRRCFAPAPNDRPESFYEVAETCIDAYGIELSSNYPRVIPDVLPADTLTIQGREFKPGTRPRLDRSMNFKRETISGRTWSDPAEWIATVNLIAGNESENADSLLLPISGSTRSQVLSDLASYDQAYALFEKVIPATNRDVALKLARFLDEKAVVHECAGDLAGRLACLKKAVAIRDELVHDGAGDEVLLPLAISNGRYATALVDAGMGDAAEEQWDQAIRLLSSMPAQALELGDALAAQARHLLARNKTEKGVEILQRAIATYQACRQNELGWKADWRRADILGELAGFLLSAGDASEALITCEDAVKILERLIALRHIADLNVSLSSAYFVQAEVLAVMGQKERSFALYTKTFGLRDRLLKDDYPSGELRGSTARLYAKAARRLLSIRAFEKSLTYYEESIKLLEAANRDGHTEFLLDLSRVQADLAKLLLVAGEKAQAVALLNKAILSFEYLAGYSLKPDVLGSLVLAWEGKAIALMQESGTTAVDEFFEEKQRKLMEFASASKDDRYGRALNLLRESWGRLSDAAPAPSA